MESHLQHPRGHDEHHPNAGLSTVAEGGEHGHHHGGGDEHHHDHGPKAVIKKVKAKAKKIKETLTKHGHGHEHHEDRTHDDEEDEEEELVDDPEIHGAPMYESAAIRSGIAGPQSGGVHSHITDPATRPFGAWQEEKSSGHAPSATPWTTSGQENISRAAAVETPSATPWDTAHGTHAPTAQVPLSSATHGTHAPATGTTQAHVSSPYATHTRWTHTPDTGTTTQVHVPPSTHGTHSPAMQTQAHVPSPSTTHGTHSPAMGMTHGTHAPAKGTTQAPFATHGTNTPAFSQGNKEQPTVRLGPSIQSPLDEDPQGPKGGRNPSNYESKVSDPTGLGEEVGITSLLHSMDKMKVHHDDADPHRKQEGYTGSHEQFSPGTDSPLKSYDPTNPEDLPRDTFTKPDSSYTGQISSATSAIAGKAVAAKNAVASKLGYGGEATTDQSDKAAAAKDAMASKLGYGGEAATAQSSNMSSGSSITDKAAAAKNTVASKLGYGGEATTDKSSNTSGGSSITDKAVAAKNAVASKLGYGGEATTDKTSVNSGGSSITDKAVATDQSSTASSTDQSSNTSSASDYGHKIASSVTGTLAPVYGKVAGVGSTVVSKVTGGGSGGSGMESTAGEEKGSDKGVSVKEYLVEKLRPGEEDRVLSEVITHSMYKADVFKEKEDRKDQQQQKQEEKPMGTVTQSVEVTRRLGTGDEPARKEGDGASADAGAAGQAVVDRVKGWFGMGPPNSPASSGTLLAGKKEEGRKE